MEKSTIQVSAKPDIISDPLSELIRNGTSQVEIINTLVEARPSSKPYYNNMINSAFSTGANICQVVRNSYFPQRTTYRLLLTLLILKCLMLWDPHWERNMFQ
ncbi:MAG: hypothetical protein ACTS73_09040 [Arsenophonus sp. NEOnobi-MAG3]